MHTNKLECDFHVSKQHLIRKLDSWLDDRFGLQTFTSSPISISYNGISRKCLKQTPNINMLKSKWDDAEERTINNFYTIDVREY